MTGASGKYQLAGQSQVLCVAHGVDEIHKSFCHYFIYATEIQQCIIHCPPVHSSALSMKVHAGDCMSNKQMMH